MTLTTVSSPEKISFKQNLFLKIATSFFFIFWTWTLIGTSNVENWLLENLLVILFLAFIIVTYSRFKFSDLSYCLILVYLTLHVYGSKYTYAENPFGFWLQDIFLSSRNHYDRIVHFSFGFLMAYPMGDFFTNRFHWPVWVC